MSVGYIIPTNRGLNSNIISYIETFGKNEKCNFELIIVNDRSDIDLYNSDFPYFSNIELKIINNQRICGPGESRNIGLKFVNSRYVSFIDDDDLLDMEFLKHIASININESDIICLNFNDSNGTFSNKVILDKFENFSRVDGNLYCQALEEDGRLPTHCQNYLFKLSFIKSNKISFLPLTVVEDITFVTECLIKSNDIQIYNIPYYFYNSNSGTTKDSFGLNISCDIISSITHLESLRKKYNNNIDHTKKQILLNRVLKFLNEFYIIKTYQFLMFYDLHFFYFFLRLGKFNFPNLSYEFYRTLLIGLNIYFDRIDKNFFSKMIQKETDIIILYCRGPAQFVFENIIKFYYDNQIIVVDDNIKTVAGDVCSFRDAIDLIVFNKENSNIKILVCHGHDFVVEKIFNNINFILHTFGVDDSNLELFTLESILS